MTRLIDPNHDGHHRATRCTRSWVIMLAVLFVGLFVDLGSKSLSFRHVGNFPIVLDREQLAADPAHDPTRGHPVYSPLPGDVIVLRNVLNPGAVFGIGAHKRGFFVGFTLVAILAGLTVFGLHTTARDRRAHVAIGLVLAGALGNLFDRLAFGRVRDMIQFMPGRHLPNGWTWPGTNNPEMFPWVFNVADVLLLVGMLIILFEIKRIQRARRALSDETSTAAA